MDLLLLQKETEFLKSSPPKTLPKTILERSKPTSKKTYVKSEVPKLDKVISNDFQQHELFLRDKALSIIYNINR